MKAYWILFLLILIIQLFPVRKNTEKISNIKLVISLFFLFIFGAIRVDFGNDYSSYETVFDDVKKESISMFYESFSELEIGYLLLNKIMPSFRVLLIVLSAFTCITYYFLFKRYVPPKYYWLGFVLMAIAGDKMVFFQYSGLRNAVAINIMMLSIPLIKNRKLTQYLLLTVLAFLFHKTILFIMPLAYFVATPQKISIRSIFGWSIVFFILLFASSTTLINTIAPLIDTYFDKYTYYIENAYENTHNTSIFMYSFVFLIFGLSIVILKKCRLSENDIVILKLSLLFVITLLLGVLNFRMSQNLVAYFVVGTTIVMNRVDDKILKNIYLMSIMAFLLYAFFVVYLGNPEFAYREYYTIFD